jgi:Protein of unknown function (DUF4232)
VTEVRLLWLISVAAALAAPPCAAGAVAPRVDTNGASGRIYVFALLWNRSRRPCTATGRVTASLVDVSTRNLLGVAGNPHSKRVRIRLRPGRNTVFTLEWENYCGPGRPMLFVVRFGRRRATQRSNYPGARCETIALPSRLRPVRIPRTAAVAARRT